MGDTYGANFVEQQCRLAQRHLHESYVAMMDCIDPLQKEGQNEMAKMAQAFAEVYQHQSGTLIMFPRLMDKKGGVNG